MKKNCLAIDYAKPILFPEEGEYVNVQNFKRLIKALLITCGNFECVLIPSIDNIAFVPNTKKIQRSYYL